jgi:quercetin dioxygenase-like cupin family protein
MQKNKAEHDHWPTTGPIVSLPASFEDARGVIQTLVDGGFQSVQIISSRAKSVRANHYHLTDSHYMYVLEGKMKYFHRPAGAEGPPEWVYVNAGQMIFSPPLVEHAVEFIEDSLFLNITGKSRDQSTYENDLVRVNLHSAQTDKLD